MWGKILGSVTGFAMGGPFGAIIGALAGHAYDVLRSPSGPDPIPRLDGPGGWGANTKQMAFSLAVVVLGAKMAKADGVVSRAEVNAFKEVFRIRPQDERTVGRIFDAAKTDASGYQPYAERVALLFRHEPAILEELLGGLFHIARADGPISRVEMDYLREVARLLGLSDAAFERVKAAFVGPSHRDAFDVLGLTRAAGNAEIKRAYRQLIRENHPDTLIAKGMPSEFIELANQRMAAINAAYDQIARERGIK